MEKPSNPGVMGNKQSMLLPEGAHVKVAETYTVPPESGWARVYRTDKSGKRYIGIGYVRKDFLDMPAKATQAEEPRPEPSGASELTETLKLGLNEYSLATASTTLPMGRSAALESPFLSELTANLADSLMSTLTFLFTAAASAQAPCTTKCSPVMIALQGASADAINR